MTEFTIAQSMHDILSPPLGEQGDGCLICIYPADKPGGLWTLDGESTVLGRVADCDIPVEDEAVSRRHAVIRKVEQGYVLTDLGSTNGTCVNERRVVDHPLQREDRIRIGQHIFKFLDADDIEVQYHHTLYRMVTTDALTQAHNRQYMEETLERELLRSSRHDRPLTLLMLDIDFFKRVNDQAGHLAGDEVLQEFSRRIRELVKDEVFCRYGGEEFAIVAGECCLASGAQLAEAIRQSVASLPFDTNAGPLDITVSIGAVEAREAGAKTPADLIAGADQRLYQAKESGRNRVVSG